VELVEQVESSPVCLRVTHELPPLLRFFNKFKVNC
jgi:hypothetical protein